MKTLSWNYYLRLACHVFIVMIVTIQTIDWNVLNASYGISLRQTFLYYFGTEDMISSDSNNQIFTYDEAVDAINRVFDSYASIGESSVGNFKYGYRDVPGEYSNTSSEVAECRSTAPPLRATTYYWSQPTELHSDTRYLLSLEDLFTSNSSGGKGIEDYFSVLDSLHLRFDLCNYANPSTTNPSGHDDDSISGLRSSDCNYWTVTVDYQFISQMYLEVFVDAQLGASCSSQKGVNGWLSGLLILLLLVTPVYIVLLLQVCTVATLYLLNRANWSIYVFILQDIKSSLDFYLEVKEVHRLAREKFLKNPSSCSEAEAITGRYAWADVPTGIKRGFHSYWSLLTLLGLCTVLIEAIYTLASKLLYLYSHLDRQ
jgi:hypothetical protein